MFENEPQFASDLDWMLQSGQAPRELILEALVTEYYPDVFYLALSILDDQAAATKATQATFATALENIYTYREDTGVGAWFYRLTIDACRQESARVGAWRSLKALLPLKRKPGDFGVSEPETGQEAAIWLGVDSLGETPGLIVLLYYLHNWEIPTISRTLELPEHEILNSLQKSITRLQQLIDAPDLESEENKDESLDLKEVELLLRDSLKRRWPREEISSDDLEPTLQKILSQAGMRGIRTQVVSHFKELAAIGLIILIAVGSFWGINAFNSGNQAPNEGVVYVTNIINVTSSPSSGNIPLAAAAQSNTGTATPIPNDAIYSVKPGDSLESLSDRWNSSVQEIRDINRIPPDGDVNPGHQLLIPGRLPPLEIQSATPVAPLPPAAPLLEPLTAEDILNRMLIHGHLYNTLWLDAQVIDYGPQGYIGPPQITRMQAWMSQNQALVLIGEPYGRIEEVWLQSHGGNTYRAVPGNGQPWFFELTPEDAENSPVAESISLLYTTLKGREQIGSGDSLTTVARENQAGRQTLVVDQTNGSNESVSRFWLDDRSGLVLRKVFYSQGDFATAETEIAVTAIAYDVDFPQEFFDPRMPWRGGFAEDYTGKPESLSALAQPEIPGRQPLAHQMSLEGFDPTQSRLTFQFSYPVGEDQANTMVDLFADDYFLGNIPFGNPWSMICERSADGALIAYVSQPSRVVARNSTLYCFSLTTDGCNLEETLSQLAVTQFAFSPDNRTLAAVGFPDSGETGAIYLIDTQAKTQQAILDVSEASSLVWHPDGDQLAFTAKYLPESTVEHLVVIETRNGTITFSAPFDRESPIMSEWPIWSWGVDFPVEMGGLEACVSPPE